LRHFSKASVEQFVRAQRIMSVQCCIDVRETLERRTDRSVVWCDSCLSTTFVLGLLLEYQTIR